MFCNAEKLDPKDFNNEKIIGSINGIVQSSGIQIDIRAWLDIGSKEWRETSEDQKIAAYDAVRKSGWSKLALRKLALENFIHLSEETVELTFEILERTNQK